VAATSQQCFFVLFYLRFFSWQSPPAPPTTIAPASLVGLSGLSGKKGTSLLLAHSSHWTFTHCRLTSWSLMSTRSTKAVQRRGAEDQASGTPSLTSTQACFVSVGSRDFRSVCGQNMKAKLKPNAVCNHVWLRNLASV
jgi:hypothetical protein